MGDSRAKVEIREMEKMYLFVRDVDADAGFWVWLRWGSGFPLAFGGWSFLG
jgi:hypothetical protein